MLPLCKTLKNSFYACNSSGTNGKKNHHQHLLNNHSSAPNMNMIGEGGVGNRASARRLNQMAADHSPAADNLSVSSYVYERACSVHSSLNNHATAAAAAAGQRPADVDDGGSKKPALYKPSFRNAKLSPFPGPVSASLLTVTSPADEYARGPTRASVSPAGRTYTSVIDSVSPSTTKKRYIRQKNSAGVETTSRKELRSRLATSTTTSASTSTLIIPVTDEPASPRNSLVESSCYTIKSESKSTSLNVTNNKLFSAEALSYNQTKLESRRNYQDQLRVSLRAPSQTFSSSTTTSMVNINELDDSSLSGGKNKSSYNLNCINISRPSSSSSKQQQQSRSMKKLNNNSVFVKNNDLFAVKCSQYQNKNLNSDQQKPVPEPRTPLKQDNSHSAATVESTTGHKKRKISLIRFFQKHFRDRSSGSKCS